MNQLCLIGIFVSVVCSQDVEKNKPALEYESNLNENEYHFRYKTSDAEREENGLIDKYGALAVYGFYSFTGTDGKTYRVDFIADENGYRPRLSSAETVTETQFGFPYEQAEEKEIHIDIRFEDTTDEDTPIWGISSEALGSLLGGGMG